MSTIPPKVWVAASLATVTWPGLPVYIFIRSFLSVHVILEAKSTLAWALTVQLVNQIVKTSQPLLTILPGCGDGGTTGIESWPVEASKVQIFLP